jgi:hypothetical protein
MYSFQPDTNAWSLLTDLQRTTLCSLTYSSDEDRFYGLEVGMGSGEYSIHDFAPSGAFGRETSLGRRAAENDRMMLTQVPPQIVAAGKHLVILFPPRGGRDPSLSTTGPMSCMVLDAKTRKTIYTGEMSPRAEAIRDMTPAKFERLWDALNDNATAHEAEQALAAGGDSTVKLLRAKLPPLAPIEPQPKAQLPADDAIDTITNAELRREARAIRVLGLIGSPSAADFLRHLARGPAGAPRVQLAKSALRRF